MGKFRYGDNKTIHRTGELNIERDPETGAVVSVWFRCALIPFTDHVVDTERAESMRNAYKEHKVPSLQAIVFEDEEEFSG